MATKPTAVAKAKSNLPANINAEMAAEIAEIQKRIGAPSGNKIQVTQQKTMKLPSGVEVEELEGVIVDFAAANFYYTQGYQRDTVIPPVCFSLGLEPAGMTPSPNSPDIQAGACASCWANQFKSANNGKGKACSNYRLLAILPTDADAETPLAVLKVSATALKSFDGHVGEVARKFSLPVRGVVTRITFSDDDYPSLRFTTVGPTPKDLMIMAHARRDEAQKLLLVEPEVKAANDEAPAKRPAAKKVARR